MAVSMNVVVLAGNLCRDPELHYSEKGTAVGSFDMAVSRKFTGGDGGYKSEVCYVRVVTFGRQGENVCEFCHKGDPVMVQGRLKQNYWEKDGKKQSRLEVVGEKVQFLLKKGTTFTSNETLPEPLPGDGEEMAEGEPVAQAVESPSDIPF